MTFRSIIRFVGWVVPPLGRILAWTMPVAVPGLTPGAEPLTIGEDKYGNKNEYSVAVIGGGIAGCGAAWNLAKDGFKVTLYEARKQISGNARTFEWDFSPVPSQARSRWRPGCQDRAFRSRPGRLYSTRTTLASLKRLALKLSISHCLGSSTPRFRVMRVLSGLPILASPMALLERYSRRISVFTIPSSALLGRQPTFSPSSGLPGDGMIRRQCMILTPASVC